MSSLILPILGIVHLCIIWYIRFKMKKRYANKIYANRGLWVTFGIGVIVLLLLVWSSVVSMERARVASIVPPRPPVQVARSTPTALSSVVAIAVLTPDSLPPQPQQVQPGATPAVSTPAPAPVSAAPVAVQSIPTSLSVDEPAALLPNPAPGAEETAVAIAPAPAPAMPILSGQPGKPAAPLATPIAQEVAEPTQQAVQQAPGGPAQAPARQAPPSKPKPANTPDPNLLSNGVRYGDHTPNVQGRIVRIASPNIKLDTSVYEVYINRARNEWEVADYAAGHSFNSANPGDGGNIVVSGHNNWKGEVFRYLENLKQGDLIQVWTLAGKEYDYRVQVTEKLQEAGVSYAERLKHAAVMDPTAQEQLTLITCWPYTTFTHRLVIIATPVR